MPVDSDGQKRKRGQKDGGLDDPEGSVVSEPEDLARGSPQYELDGPHVDSKQGKEVSEAGSAGSVVSPPSKKATPEPLLLLRSNNNNKRVLLLLGEIPKGYLLIRSHPWSHFGLQLPE